MPMPFESYAQLLGFFWVFFRVSVILFFLPLLGARGVPTLWKIGFAFALTLVLFPLVPLPRSFPQTTPEILLALACEVLFGFVLIFGVRVLIAAVQMAGQFMSFQMGFSISQVFDPNEGVQSDTLSQFLYIFTILIFFALDGHHLFIRGLAASFQEVPINSFSLKPALAGPLIQITGHMFVIALKIAAPIIITLFLANLCLGIVARTVPQVNILMIGFPINIVLGMIVFMLVLGAMLPLITDLVRQMDTFFTTMMHSR